MGESRCCGTNRLAVAVNLRRLRTIVNKCQFIWYNRQIVSNFGSETALGDLDDNFFIQEENQPN